MKNMTYSPKDSWTGWEGVKKSFEAYLAVAFLLLAVGVILFPWGVSFLFKDELFP